MFLYTFFILVSLKSMWTFILKNTNAGSLNELSSRVCM